MKTASLKDIVKWLWLGAVLIFVAGFVHRKWDIIVGAFARLPLTLLCLSALLIALAKLCLIFNMMQVTGRFSIKLGWLESYRIYNVTELGKYIPGSIWQFIGRITVLRERGASSQSIRDALLAEHIGVAGMALGAGVLLVIISQPEWFYSWWHDDTFRVAKKWLIALPVLGALAIGGILVLGRHALRWLLRLLPTPRTLPALIVVWLSFGASLWVLFVPFTASAPPFLYVVGVYCLAYVIGFVVPIAPAGLGVREAILTMALISLLPPDLVFFLVAVNRLLNFSVELLMAGVCLTAGRECLGDST